MLTHDDVIRLAREAGFEVGRDAGGVYVAPQYSDSVGTLVRFAALVAASEREECAKDCEEISDNVSSALYSAAAFDCSEAIRTRGEKGGV